MELLNAVAFHHTLEMRTVRDVDLSAFIIQIALVEWLVFDIIVWIHAPVFAVHMLNVKSLIMFQSVLVKEIIKVIHSPAVDEFHNNVSFTQHEL